MDRKAPSGTHGAAGSTSDPPAIQKADPKASSGPHRAAATAGDLRASHQATLANSEKSELAAQDYRALGAFRFQIRRFLYFSETAARSEGLEPQQHQALLAIRCLDVEGGPTVRQIADRLFIRHNSAVGLVDRLAEHGMVERVRGGGDRREVRIRLTEEGNRRLNRLSAAHYAELRTSGPTLVEALAELLRR